MSSLLLDEREFWDNFHLYYVGVLFHYYHLWKTGHKTIKDSGYVLIGK